MEHASAVLRRERVMRSPHVEEHAAVFEHRGLRMFDEKRFERARELRGAGL